MRRIITIGLLCCGLGVGIAGCADPNIKPRHLEFGSSTDTLVMGGNLRLVDERDRPVGPHGPVLPTVCTEPSPDVAIAFGRKLAGQGNYSQPSGPTVSGNITIDTTETVSALEGRTAGVLALRDGLYAACQSYVNGVLGHDAYAMILSQYGNLLVALAGTGKSGNPTAMTAQETAISAMLVACISEHDPTRIRPIKPSGQPDTNPLLSEVRCKHLLNRIAQGQLLAPPKKAAAAATNVSDAGVLPKGTEITNTITSQKVTKKTAQ